jgi:7-carboxy-7-deazaguanine synthase
MSLRIEETFQLTVQGEGYHAGTPADFIRLWGCSVGCDWCDTHYSKNEVKPKNWTMRSIDDLLAELISPLTVITGGEPFEQANMPELVDEIIETGRECAIETSGVKWLDVSDRAWITFSPKQAVTGREPDPRFWLRANEVKIVVSSALDLTYYLDRLQNYSGRVYFQPEWSVHDEVVPMIIDAISTFEPRAKLSLQTHKFIGVR